MPPSSTLRIRASAKAAAGKASAAIDRSIGCVRARGKMADRKISIRTEAAASAAPGLMHTNRSPECHHHHLAPPPPPRLHRPPRPLCRLILYARDLSLAFVRSADPSEVGERKGLLLGQGARRNVRHCGEAGWIDRWPAATWPLNFARRRRDRGEDMQALSPACMRCRRRSTVRTRRGKKTCLLFSRGFTTRENVRSRQESLRV